MNEDHLHGLRAKGWRQRPDGEWEKPSHKRLLDNLAGGEVTPLDTAKLQEGPNSAQGRPAKAAEGKSAPSGDVPKNERALHDTFEGWCRVTGLFYIHSRTDRKTTNRVGLCDFFCIRGDRVCAIEFKHGDGKLRPEQEEVIAELLASGTPVLVTNDAGTAILWTKRQLEKGTHD